MLGDSEGEPKVACPLHKRTFSLNTGAELAGGDLQLLTFKVRISPRGSVELEVGAPPPPLFSPLLTHFRGRWISHNAACALRCRSYSSLNSFFALFFFVLRILLVLVRVLLSRATRFRRRSSWTRSWAPKASASRATPVRTRPRAPTLGPPCPTPRGTKPPFRSRQAGLGFL